jgi:hypothetical protein
MEVDPNTDIATAAHRFLDRAASSIRIPAKSLTPVTAPATPD